MCVSTQGERCVDEVEYESDEYEAMSDESHMQEAVITKKPDEEDVTTKDDHDEVPVSNKSAAETIAKMSGEIDMQEAVVTKKPDEQVVTTKDDNDEVPVAKQSATETAVATVNKVVHT